MPGEKHISGGDCRPGRCQWAWRGIPGRCAALRCDGRDLSEGASALQAAEQRRWRLRARAAAALRLGDRTVVGMGRVLLFGGMCIAFRRGGLFFCALGLVEP
jgi:hypothetical protein